MKDIKLLIRSLLILLLAAIILLLPIGAALALDFLPRRYDKTYYRALQDKYDRATSIEGEKIIVVGGSNIAFGIDSALIEETLGTPCVNFGLYAALGLDYMLDLAEQAIGEGDTVVIIPELDPQMYSSYFGSDAVLIATEGRLDMKARTDLADIPALIKAFPSYIIKKIGYLRSNSCPEPSDVYAYSSFDERGDMIFVREENIMDGAYKTDSRPSFDLDMISEDFVSLINGFTEKAVKRGATVYFSFPPLDSLSVDATEEEIADFIAGLCDKLDCRVISSIADRILDPGYFYDSNYHTNGRGETVNTVLLINDLKRCRGDMSPTEIELPRPYDVEVELPGEELEADGFRYTVSASGLSITGLSDEMKTKEEIAVPSSLSGYSVTKVADRAFDSCEAKKITFPTSVTTFGSALFSGCENLEEIVLPHTKLPSVGDSLLKDAPESVTIWVDHDLYDYYLTDYFWMGYADNIKRK